MKPNIASSLVAEAVGTFTLIFCGAGAILASNSTGAFGLTGIALAHGLAIMTMVYAFGHISGGHFNPAVTFGMLITRKIKLAEGLLYVLAQLAGSAAGAMMLRFLASNGRDLNRLSVADLGCCYGWFVSEFSKRGCRAIGVDRDPAALKIGRIAYALHSGQLVQSDIMKFLHNCDQTFEVVLLLSVLQDFAKKPDFGSPEEVLKRVDAITGSFLFLETGQNHEAWYRNSLPVWDKDFIIKLVRQHTSFTHVLPLGVGSDDVGFYSDNYGRTLFVCSRT